jgi:predicted kinase
MAQLVVMTGLPCSGKSTVAYGIAGALQWPVFSVDPIDSAMRGDGVDPDTAGSAAYSVAAALAAEQLGLGISVVIDAVNAHPEAREMWRDLAARTGAHLLLIECACHDEMLHRARVSARVRRLAHYPELTWDYVEETRATYAPWEMEKLQLETSDETPAKLVARALVYIHRDGEPAVR